MTIASQNANDRQYLADHLQPVFIRYGDILAAVYLFGSQAIGEATDRSDIDLGILFKPAAVSAAASHRFTLFAECSRALKRNDIDLVVLNTAANLILQDEIIRTGILLYDGDGEARIDYELKTLHQALDFRFQRQLAMGV
jgi:predicted nucleotidyltransferase